MIVIVCITHCVPGAVWRGGLGAESRDEGLARVLQGTTDRLRRKRRPTKTDHLQRLPALLKITIATRRQVFAIQANAAI